MARYRVHGITLETDPGFALPPATGVQGTDLVFERAADPIVADRKQPGHPLHRGRWEWQEAEIAFYGPLERPLVSVGRSVTFECAAHRIVCHAADVNDIRIERAFLGPVLALWLERRGVLALRGSAVIAADRATVILSHLPPAAEPLAPALVARGATLASRGLVALEIGPSGTVLNTDSSRGAAGAAGGATLDRILVVEPTGEPRAAITDMHARAAVMAIVRHSYLAVPVVRFGLQADRLGKIAALLRSVRCQRVSLPTAPEAFDEVAASLAFEVSGQQDRRARTPDGR